LSLLVLVITGIIFVVVFALLVYSSILRCFVPPYCENGDWIAHIGSTESRSPG
jgi:hypothetical protein